MALRVRRGRRAVVTRLYHNAPVLPQRALSDVVASNRTRFRVARAAPGSAEYLSGTALRPGTPSAVARRGLPARSPHIPVGALAGAPGARGHPERRGTAGECLRIGMDQDEAGSRHRGALASR
jgi:hypothetical protein